jgi:hypothetical protein
MSIKEKVSKNPESYPESGLQIEILQKIFATGTMIFTHCWSHGFAFEIGILNEIHFFEIMVKNK